MHDAATALLLLMPIVPHSDVSADGQRLPTPTCSVLWLPQGLGEPILLVLRLAGVPFEDERISYAEVAARREDGRYLPFVILPGRAQRVASLRGASLASVVRKSTARGLRECS